MLFHLGVWCLSVSPECMVFELEPVVSTVRNLTPSFQRIFYFSLCLFLLWAHFNYNDYFSQLVFLLIFLCLYFVLFCYSLKKHFQIRSVKEL